MTTNEKILNTKIAEWFGFEIYKSEYNVYKVLRSEHTKSMIKLDFLHDRNQQKWIIDELEKRGYRIKIYISEYGTQFRIWHNDTQLEVQSHHIKENDGGYDTALISTVEQLIDKESESNKTNI